MEIGENARSYIYASVGDDDGVSYASDGETDEVIALCCNIIGRMIAENSTTVEEAKKKLKDIKTCLCASVVIELAAHDVIPVADLEVLGDQKTLRKVEPKDGGIMAPGA